MQARTRPISLCVFSLVMATGLGGVALSSAYAQNTLSPCTTNVFTPDGDIGEFINFAGDSQEYFVVDSVDPDFGKIKSGADLACGVFVARDNFPGSAGPSGFEDRPGAASGDEPTQIPTAFNLGRMFVSYNPQLDAYFVAFDVSAPGALDTGVIPGTQSVAFDVDGNGDLCTLTEINASDCAEQGITEAPAQGDDTYRVLLDFNQDGFNDVRVEVVETTGSPPAGSVVLTSYNCGGSLPFITRYLRIEPLGAGPIDATAFANAHLDSDGDGVADAGSVGVGADVEFMISNVSKGCDQSVDPNCANDPFLTRNTDPCCVKFTSFVDTDDDDCLGGGAEDGTTWEDGFPCPDLEVTKKVRCVDPPDGTFDNSVDVLPGSELEFQVTMRNWGNRDLNPVTIEDLFECIDPATVTLVPGSCICTPPRPVFCTAFENSFQVGEPFTVPFETLPGPPGAPECPVVGEGETVTCSFRVTTGESDPAFCDSDIDCTNRISVSGTTSPSENPIPDDEEEDGDVDDEFTVTVEDEAAVIDTEREEAAAEDDNVTEMEIVCREITLTKEVRLLPDGTFTSDLSVPRVPEGGELIIEYRYTVTNGGEIPETISLTDLFLCRDVNSTAGVEFVAGECDLCEGVPAGPGEIIDTIPAGESRSYTCQVRFTSQDALRDFLTKDNERADCTADPGPGEPDDDCYRNCAEVTTQTDLTDICLGPGEAPGDSDFATICNEECELQVIKQVRCLPDCDKTALDPEEGWVDDPVLLQVAPDSCVQYRIIVENTSSNVEVCGLKFNDQMLDKNDFASGPDNCHVDPPGRCSNLCPFNWDDTDIASRCDPPLQPGETVTVMFDARLASAGAVNPGDVPTNRVTVMGAAGGDCPDVGPINYSCEGTDSAAVEILTPGLECNGKTWQFQWDEDCDGTPNPPFSAPSSSIDLRDKVFPVRLRLCIDATNTGDVPLSVTASDTALTSCVTGTPGVSFATPPACELDMAKTVAPGATEQWCCEILVDSGEAMRALDACDGQADKVYENTASVSGTMVSGDTAICVPPSSSVEGVDAGCSADIQVPQPCTLSVEKDVKCADDPDSAYAGDVDAFPGTTQTFRIRITNQSALTNVTQVCIRDTLTCATWFKGTVTATLNGDDVSADFSSFAPNGVEQCFDFSSRTPAWMEPGEVLTITFDVNVPDDFSIVGIDPDCTNTVNLVRGFVDCDDDPIESCSTGPASAQIDVQVPSVDCDKCVCLDSNSDDLCDTSCLSDLQANIDCPNEFQLRYRFTVNNNGETDLAGAKICDPIFFEDAETLLVGCDHPVELNRLDPDFGCIDIGDVALGGTEHAWCTVAFSNLGAWEDFANSTCPGGKPAYVNTAQARATPVVGGDICDDPPPPEVESGDCMARFCCGVEECERPPCPPWTKANFDIWNENEIRFSGTHRCIESWDQTLLSDYTAGGIANHFWRNVLQTVKGKARIHGLGSRVVCGDEAVDVPLLGVAAKVLHFNNEVDLAGMNLVGSGTMAGVVLYDLPGGPEPSVYGDAGENVGKTAPVVLVEDIGRYGSGGTDGEDISIEAGVGGDISFGVRRASTSKKGSFIVYPKFEIKWDSGGNLIQDTFIDLSNDGDAPVDVQLYIVDADCCVWVDNVITLTANEPTYWSVLTGDPKGVSPATSLGRGSPDDDPLNPGGRVLRGYILAWAVDPVTGAEIAWNNLKGDAVLVNYGGGSAWEYNAWSFQVVAEQTNGDGRLDLNGTEYDWAPASLLLDFYSVGAIVTSAPGKSASVDTDLTLWAAFKDLRRAPRAER